MFAGAREEETVRAIFCPLTGGAPIANDAAFDLLNALRAHGCDWIDARQAMPRPEGAIDVLDEARALLARQSKMEVTSQEGEKAHRVRLPQQRIRRDRKSTCLTYSP